MRDRCRVIDAEHCYRAAQAVTDASTASSSSPSRRPASTAVRAARRRHLSVSTSRFYPTAAAAQEAGYRACKRCQPDAAPGSSEWDRRGDLAGRAMRLIADGLVDREGVAGLARTLGYSERQLRRHLVAELGTGPLALARARRAQTARHLMEETDLSVSAVAFAAGFGSVRQFNDTIQTVYALTPSEIRRAAPPRRPRPGHDRPAARLPAAARARGRSSPSSPSGRSPESRTADASSYRRVLRLPHGTGSRHPPRTPSVTGGRRRSAASSASRISATSGPPSRVAATSSTSTPTRSPSETSSVADPSLAPLRRAGRDCASPGHVDGAELAVRAVLGQQVSVRAATTLAAALVRRVGKPIAAPSGSLTHAFPQPAVIAGASPGDLGMPASACSGARRARDGARRRGRLDLGPGADRDEARRTLLGLPGHRTVDRRVHRDAGAV